MSDNADDRMKMLSLNRTKTFFPYEEGHEGGEVYLVLAQKVMDGLCDQDRTVQSLALSTHRLSAWSLESGAGFPNR